VFRGWLEGWVENPESSSSRTNKEIGLRAVFRGWLEGWVENPESSSSRTNKEIVPLSRITPPCTPFQDLPSIGRCLSF